jgi:hypothetical protein
MDDAQIRLECLKISQCGSAELSLKAAKLFYDWVSPPEVEIQEGGTLVQRRRGRPPKTQE